MDLNFKEENPNRQITAGGASKVVDMNRNWVGTTWPIIQNNIISQTRVSLCAARSRLWVCSCELVPGNKRRGD